jgi:hypothetical protein
MRSSLVQIVIVGLLFFSCSKTEVDDPSAALAGTWKMIRVEDNSSGDNTYKPNSIQEDLIITFTPNSDTSGNFEGHTPTNSFFSPGVLSNGYTLGPDHTISIHAFSMTQISETSWGELFLNNIATAHHYNFKAGNLNIKTAAKMLFFKKQ